MMIIQLTFFHHLLELGTVLRTSVHHLIFTTAGVVT